MYYGNSNSSMGYSLVRLYETRHGVLNSKINGENSPRYFLNSSYEPVKDEEKNIIDEFLLKRKIEENNAFNYKETSGKPLCIFSFIKSPNLKLIENINYFTSPSLVPLHKRIDEISFQKNEEKETKVENKITINKIQSYKAKNKNKFEEMADNYFKLDSQERMKLNELLYPKYNTKEENKENIFYDLKDSEKVITQRSDYNLFMISN